MDKTKIISAVVAGTLVVGAGVAYVILGNKDGNVKTTTETNVVEEKTDTIDTLLEPMAETGVDIEVNDNGEAVEPTTEGVDVSEDGTLSVEIEEAKELDLGNEVLDEEETKLTNLLEDLKEAEAEKEALNSVIEEYKIEAKNGLISLPSDFIETDTLGEIKISEKGKTALKLEEGSKMMEIVMDNLMNEKNSFANTSLAYKDYELTIDESYNIKEVKKGGIIVKETPLMGISIFEISNFYKK